MGILNVVINEGRYDKDFVANWTVGFDGLVDRVKDYWPEKVEKITWVPADTVRKIAPNVRSERTRRNFNRDLPGSFEQQNQP